MKDLYTFDSSIDKALETYETVHGAYAKFFDELKIPYLTAEASSGEMGGDLSHEYHFPSAKGEDHIISCASCSYVANEESVRIKGSSTPEVTVFKPPIPYGEASSAQRPPLPIDFLVKSDLQSEYNHWIGITKDRHMIVEAIFPKAVKIQDASETSSRETQLNPHALRKYLVDIDFSVENPIKAFKEYVRKYVANDPTQSLKKPVIGRVFDYRVSQRNSQNFKICWLEEYPASECRFASVENEQLKEQFHSHESRALDLVRIETGDSCPECNKGVIKVQTAIEVGHTFHLGTRYSKPLEATIATAPSPASSSIVSTSSQMPSGPLSEPRPLKHAYFQMGCHGIGVSRLIAAVADSLADSRGLNWPRVIAPFETVIIPTKGLELAATEIYDLLAPQEHNSAVGNSPDVILDDREKDFGWKLKDADLVGYPVVVVVGRAWQHGRRCEVQCRRLDGLRMEVDAEDVHRVVSQLLEKL